MLTFLGKLTNRRRPLSVDCVAAAVDCGGTRGRNVVGFVDDEDVECKTLAGLGACRLGVDVSQQPLRTDLREHTCMLTMTRGYNRKAFACRPCVRRT